MEETIITPENIEATPVETVVESVVVEAPVAEAVAPGMPGNRPQRDNRGQGQRSGGRGGSNNNRRGPRRDTRPKSEFDQKIVSMRRVTRVVAGGRRFAFSVCVVVGNKKGMVGVGQGKAGDTPLSIDKAVRDAKKNMITVNMTKNMSIPH